MARRIERLTSVIAAAEAHLGKDRNRLIPDRPDTFDDRLGIGAGVLERTVQVVHDRKPLPDDGRSLLCPHPFGLPGEALTQVVGVGEGPLPLTVAGLERSAQVRDRGGCVLKLRPGRLLGLGRGLSRLVRRPGHVTPGW